MDLDILVTHSDKTGEFMFYTQIEPQHHQRRILFDGERASFWSIIKLMGEKWRVICYCNVSKVIGNIHTNVLFMVFVRYNDFTLYPLITSIKYWQSNFQIISWGCVCDDFMSRKITTVWYDPGFITGTTEKNIVVCLKFLFLDEFIIGGDDLQLFNSLKWSCWD